MKFKLKQPKMVEMLEKLQVKDMFSSSVVQTKDQKLFSLQKEPNGRAFRFVKFNKSYFDEIDDSKEIIEIDIEQILKIVKAYPSDMVLTAETKENKLLITRMITTEKGMKVKGRTNIPFKKPEEVEESLPFEFKDGVPLVGEAKIPLDVFFTIDLSEFKSSSEMEGKVNSDMYKFAFVEHEGKHTIEVRIGDLMDYSIDDKYYPDCVIEDGESLDVAFTYGMQQIADTFRQKNVSIKTHSNSPAWIYETTDDYLLGVFIPPYEEN